MSGQAKKKPIYRIPGDTVNERKRAVQQLMKRLGYKIDLRQITQTKGMLCVRWEPPFPEQFMKQVEALTRYAAVFFGPDGSEAQLAYIDIVFEREPGLFMDDLILRRPVILESLDRLPALLSSHVQYVQEYKRKSESQRQEGCGLESESEPEQQSLW